MPVFNFNCNACQKDYEELCVYDTTGKYKKVKCPFCGSKKKEKLLSLCSIKFTNPVGTSKFDNFGYRAGFNMEKAKAERRAAEEKTHMGNSSDIYTSTNDLNIDSNFGEIK